MAASDQSDEFSQLEAKMQPARIRSTLAFAGLYQLTHEMIKQAVLDEVRGFYLTGFDESSLRYDEVEYRSRVLAKAPKD